MGEGHPAIRCQARLAVALTACAVGAAWAVGETYPSRPIRLVIPFAPGGTADVIGRPMAQRLADLLGQSLVADNRGGAGGALAAGIVAKAVPDGYTIILGSSGAFTISPSLGAKLPYDPVTDFAPIGLIAGSQFILVTHPTLAAQTVRELIALAKSRPGKLSYGSAGNGNVGHLAAELFKSMAGVDLVHVPYKGAGPMTVDLLAGQVDLGFPGLSSLVPHIKTGRVRALAVTGLRRSAVLPDLPTLAESGLPGYEATTWWGLLAPAKVPRGAIDRLNAALAELARSAELRDYYLGTGNELRSATPAEFAALLRADIDKWAKIIKGAGIRSE